MRSRLVSIIILSAVLALSACTRDPYVKTMREGARSFDRGDYTEAAGLFKQTLEDTTFAGLYNYALSSHEAEDDVEAIRALDTLRKQELVEPDYEVPAALNLANACLTEAVRTEAKEAEMDPQQQQGGQAVALYRQAMETYEEYLLEVPGDMDAKERYLYCKSKMPPQDGGGGGGDDQQNQDQNQNQDQQDQDQNQDQQDQNQDQDNQDQQNQDQQQQQDQQDQLNENQIYQMLEAKEKETREKVDEKQQKAVLLRQKDRKKW